MESDPAKYPGFTGETFPEAFTVPPPQPAVKKPGQLPSEKVQEYFDNGFLVVENLFTPEELEPVRDCYRRLVDDLAQKLYKTNRVKSTDTRFNKTIPSFNDKEEKFLKIWKRCEKRRKCWSPASSRFATMVSSLSKTSHLTNALNLK